MIFGSYQAFPSDLWQREFKLAYERGLEHIEWVADSPSLDHNPIFADASAIKTCCDDFGVNVVSVCADFLMDQPLDVDVPGSWRHIDNLLTTMASLNVKYMVIPCVDSSSLSDHGSRNRLLRSLRVLHGYLEDGDIHVALETDLPPVAFRELLEELDPDRFGVNYDIGNSASIGFDPADELGNYGDRVELLHVKDRQLHGGSVRLGTGSADIRGVLRTLRELQFEGPVTLQCFRDFEGVAVFDEQLATYRDIVRDLLDGS